MFFFKGACNSIVTINWPAGAFIVVNNGDLPGTTTINLTNSTSYQSIPCDDACCKVTYKYKIITNSNLETEHTWVPTYVGSGGNQICQNSPLPDYNIITNKLEAKVIDPVTGDTSIVTGIQIGQEPCELICNKYNAPPPPETFTTDVMESSKEITSEFSANPTLMNSFIKFTTNKPILKVLIFDMTGKKVISIILPNSNELNTSELKEGTYFIQVYFTDNSVKTVKVVKQ
jgi:hypothetical protein